MLSCATMPQLGSVSSRDTVCVHSRKSDNWNARQTQASVHSKHNSRYPARPRPLLDQLADDREALGFPEQAKPRSQE